MITGQKQVGVRQVFKLSYPNLEVQMSLTDYILHDLTTTDLTTQENNKIALYESLEVADFETLEKTFNALFLSNPMNDYEGYYASVFYCYLAALGVELIGEDTTNRGRIDLTLKLADNSNQNSALQQIKQQRYFEKYQDSGATIYLIGVHPHKRSKGVKLIACTLYSCFFKCYFCDIIT